MRRLLSMFAVLLSVSTLRAAAPDPLQYIPSAADAVIKIESPRRLVESFLNLDAVKRLRQLDAAQAYLDTPLARNLFDMLAYAEKELGAPWPELLDKLAGGGGAIGIKYGDGSKNAALLVLQGTDEEATRRFFDKALAILDEELALVEGAKKPKRAQYKGVDAAELAPGFIVARMKAALLFTTSDKVLKAAIDMQGDTSKSLVNADGPKEARKLLPGDPLAWAWVNLEPAKKQREAKELFEQPRNNIILTFAFAGILDVVRRSPFVAVSLSATEDGFLATVRMPAGREGRGGDVVLHVPDDPKSPGTLPLLEPKDVIYSHAFYQDLGALWEKRSQIMNADQVKSFEQGEKEASRFLPGASLGKVFTQSGPHWRVVATNGPKKSAYKIEPGQRSGAFAVVVSMRDPAFAKTVETMVRGGALLAGFQVGGLSLFEETFDGVKLFGYRFKEDGKFADDVDNIRFNFVPTFAAVGDQYVVASDKDLCKELIGEIRKQAGMKPQSQNMRLRLYSKGAAESLNLTPDQLITQTILGAATNAADAKKQAEAFVKYIEALGTVTLETDYADKSFRFDLKWQLKK